MSSPRADDDIVVLVVAENSKTLDAMLATIAKHPLTGQLIPAPTYERLLNFFSTGPADCNIVFIDGETATANDGRIAKLVAASVKAPIVVVAGPDELTLKDYDAPHGLHIVLKPANYPRVARAIDAIARSQSKERSEYDVFLCYAREDEAAVRELYNRLTADCFRCWPRRRGDAGRIRLGTRDHTRHHTQQKSSCMPHPQILGEPWICTAGAEYRARYRNYPTCRQRLRRSRRTREMLHALQAEASPLRQPGRTRWLRKAETVVATRCLTQARA